MSDKLELADCAKCAVMRDLLETAYRKVDEARAESDKADDEALHWKTVAAKEDAGTARRNYAAILEWKRRAEKAEAALRSQASGEPRHD